MSMKTTIEISLYPLTEQYEKVVIDFILQLKKYPNIDFETNGTSTHIFGEFNEVWNILAKEIQPVLDSQAAVFNLKVLKGELRREELPAILKGE